MRSQNAAQMAREIQQGESFKMHEKLDSGASEEEKFSSVKRTPFNPSSGRNSGVSSRGGRGRSRGSPFQSYRDGPNDQFDLQNDSRFHRNSNDNVKRSEHGESVLIVQLSVIR